MHVRDESTPDLAEFRGPSGRADIHTEDSFEVDYDDEDEEDEEEDDDDDDLGEGEEDEYDEFLFADEDDE